VRDANLFHHFEDGACSLHGILVMPGVCLVNHYIKVILLVGTVLHFLLLKVPKHEHVYNSCCSSNPSAFGFELSVLQGSDSSSSCMLICCCCVVLCSLISWSSPKSIQVEAYREIVSTHEGTCFS
jgi:hypothetical protein